MEEKKYLAIICGDWNDGDYVYNIETVNEREKDWLIHVDELIDKTESTLSQIDGYRYLNFDKLTDIITEIIEISEEREDCDGYRYLKLTDIITEIIEISEEREDCDGYIWKRKDLDEEELQDMLKNNPAFAYLYKQSTEDLGSIMDFISEWMPSGYECSCHSLCGINIYEIVDTVY